MMSAFDRYFLIIALANIVMAVAGVAGLYVLVDYLYNLETLGNYNFQEVATYYYHNTPPVLYTLAPMVTLMGASFGISRLLKNREILPLATGGLRSFRSFRMFWIAALLAAMALLAARLWLLPSVEESAATSSVANLRKAKGEAASLRDDEGNFWRIDGFDLVEGKLDGVTMIRYGDQGLPIEYCYADHLAYRDGTWFGSQRVVEVSNIADNQKRELLFVREGAVPGTTLAPNAIATRGVKRTYREYGELRGMMEAMPHRHDLRVAFYQIFAWPLLTLAFVLAGAVIALRLDVRNIFLAVALTIVLAFGVFALVFVFEKMAKKGTIGPEIGVLMTPIGLLIAGLAGLRWCAD